MGNQGKTETTVEWSDVAFTEGPEPTISYRTNLVVCEESLTRGRFVGRGWNAAGFVNFYHGRLDAGADDRLHAFWLEVDGQPLASDWEWQALETRRRDQPIAATGRPFEIHATLTLHITTAPSR